MNKLNNFLSKEKNIKSKFFSAWMIIAYIGAFLFILIQLLLLVDFAHTWNETWLDNAENKDRLLRFLTIQFSGSDITILLPSLVQDGQ